MQHGQAKRYRRVFSTSESNRVTQHAGGTHEFNIAIDAPERDAFWETDLHKPSQRAGYPEHKVRVGVTISGKRQVVNGRVWDRTPSEGHPGRESRFNPFSAAIARRLYGNHDIPDDAVVVITRSDEAGVDYEYEVILPTDARYSSVALPADTHEAYD